MKLKDLILLNRSYRRFYQDYKIDKSVLFDFIDLARLSPSARNAQPLKYILSNTPELNRKIFECLSWAGYLKEWPGPVEGEQPSAYVVMVADKDLATNYFCDHGIAAQSILLGAVEKGLGGCIVASINREKLIKVLSLPDKYELIQVIALGKPKEVIQLETLEADGDIKYWRDENQVHHVPKRKLEDLILNL